MKGPENDLRHPRGRYCDRASTTLIPTSWLRPAPSLLKLAPSMPEGLRSRLVTVLSSASWFAQGKIEDCLAALYTGGRDIVDEEIALCNVLPTEQRNAEGVLRALLRVRQRTNAAATERKG